MYFLGDLGGAVFSGQKLAFEQGFLHNGRCFFDVSSQTLFIHFFVFYNVPADFYCLFSLPYLQCGGGRFLLFFVLNRVVQPVTRVCKIYSGGIVHGGGWGGK